MLISPARTKKEDVMSRYEDIKNAFDCYIHSDATYERLDHYINALGIKYLFSIIEQRTEMFKRIYRVIDTPISIDEIEISEIIDDALKLLEE